jgi:hypothetical protein
MDCGILNQSSLKHNPLELTYIGFQSSEDWILCEEMANVKEEWQGRIL